MQQQNINTNTNYQTKSKAMAQELLKPKQKLNNARDGIRHCYTLDSRGTKKGGVRDEVEKWMKLGSITR